MLTCSTTTYWLINQPFHFQSALVPNHAYDHHRNLCFSGKTLELNALHEPSQTKAVFWNCNLCTQQLFCYQRQPQICSNETAFLKHIAWVAYIAFLRLKTADKHSPETHRTDHMEAVCFQDSTASVCCQFSCSWTSSNQSVLAQFSPKP